MHPNQEAHLQDLNSQMSNAQAELAILTAKLIPDAEHLKTFVAPEKLSNIAQDIRKSYHSPLSLKEALMAIPDEDLGEDGNWYLETNDYDCEVILGCSTLREETDEEYASRVRGYESRHIQESRKALEGELRKNVGGLQRKIRRLAQAIEKCCPKPNPEDLLKQKISSLPQSLQDDILLQVSMLRRTR